MAPRVLIDDVIIRPVAADVDVLDQPFLGLASTGPSWTYVMGTRLVLP
ncbi:hypothetical protein ACFYPX_06405 [Micromonospora zamorensis]